MLIRRLVTDDLEAVLALNGDNVPAVSAVDAPELARLVDLTSISLVAEVDDAFAGFCMVMPPGVDYASLNYGWFGAHAAELGYDDFAYLDRIVVDAGVRGKGIGAELYEAVEDSIAGTPWLLCEVNLRPRNDGSLRFHQRLGFVEVGQQETPYDVLVSMLAKDVRR